MAFKIFLLLFCMEVIGINVCLLGLYIVFKKEKEKILEKEMIDIVNKYKLEDN